jgi:branched-chain amino acid transport system ATP-binding protein
MPALLEVSELDVGHGRLQVVRGLSFDVKAGQSLAVLGANGAGKTSAIEAISGLLPKMGGAVHFAGHDVTRAPASKVAELGLALVPQWRELFPSFSVEETLQAALYAGRKRNRRDLDDIYELFPRLYERKRQIAGTLSGGEQQMLAIGRALATEPLMILLDEPTAGLAVGIVSDVVAALRKIRARGIPIVLVEQNIELAAALADDCLVLATGEMVWRGSMTEASTSEDVRKLYFGAGEKAN